MRRKNVAAMFMAGALTLLPGMVMGEGQDEALGNIEVYGINRGESTVDILIYCDGDYETTAYRVPPGESYDAVIHDQQEGWHSVKVEWRESKETRLSVGQVYVREGKKASIILDVASEGADLKIIALELTKIRKLMENWNQTILTPEMRELAEGVSNGLDRVSARKVAKSVEAWVEYLPEFAESLPSLGKSMLGAMQGIKEALLTLNQTLQSLPKQQYSGLAR